MTADIIWEMAKEELSKQLSSVAMTTWIESCEPVELTDNQLVLRVKDEFRKEIISTRFSTIITQILGELLFVPDFHLIILSEDDTYTSSGSGKQDDSFPIIPGYSFDDFIVGPSNKFAHSSAVYVSNNPGQKLNPLFIYGSSGLGKTHLLFAIGYAVKEKMPEKKITYVKGEAFMNSLITAIREGTTEQFRAKYRKVDLFLVDDIQFIAGKESTQNEFFHTFNELYEAGHQIVITSDRPPVEMTLLDDRLRTRFEGGLMADIQPPDLETRIAIARNKAQQAGLVLTDEQYNYLATKIRSNIRQLEGVINKLFAYREILGKPITKEIIDHTIEEVLRTTEGAPTPEIIIREVGKYFSLTPEQLKGSNRSQNITIPRQITMYLMRKLTPMSFNDIGTALGRNHTTAISSIQKIETLSQKKQEIAGALRDIESNIINTVEKN